MRQIYRARPKSFLDEPRRRWQFDAFAWLLRNCGGFAHFLDTELVVPSAEYFPDRDLHGHAAAAALFRRVRDHAGMADWPCVVEPETHEPLAAAAEGLRVIQYPRDERHPEKLVALFAHELARYLVENIDEPPPGGADLLEPAADLAAVFMGFGVFMVNSSAMGASWELNEGELAHALALFCLLRRLPPGCADEHLNAHLRKHVRLAAQDLERYGEDLQRLRGQHGGLDPAEHTLPTRSA